MNTLTNDPDSPTAMHWGLLVFAYLFLLLLEGATRWRRASARLRLPASAGFKAGGNASPRSARFPHHRPAALLVLPWLFWLVL